MTEAPHWDYAFDLPESAIASRPANPRSASRLLVLSRGSGAVAHHTMREFADQLRPGDLLVRNVSRVVPARLRGRKESGGRAEALLLGPGEGDNTYRALVRHKGRQRVGQKLVFEGGDSSLEAEVCAVSGDGSVALAFPAGRDPYAIGSLPLPPYIRGGIADREDGDRYQTVYATEPGSVAAPTAGLHFDAFVEESLARRGVAVADLTLHIGVGTFRPPRPEELDRGELHEEWFSLPAATAQAIHSTRERGGRIVAIGTTTCRVLESRAEADGTVTAGDGTTRLFLRPGSRFRVVDALLTNFHLPESSLLMLVAAFAGVDATRAAYCTAVAEGYRFYSYGDAMLIQ